MNGSNLFFTSYCISTLIKIGFTPDDPIIKKAHDWLNKRLQETEKDDPSLVCYMEFIEEGIGQSRIRITFFHYVLPYVAKAYMNLGCNNRHLFNSLYYLIQRSKDGIIEHPNLENSRIHPIWALFDASTCFIDFKNLHSSNWKKEYVFSCIFNKIRSYRWWSPFRLFTLFSAWTCGGIAVLVFVWIIIWQAANIATFWNTIEHKIWGGIIISLIASVIYGICGALIGYFKKRYNS